MEIHDLKGRCWDSWSTDTWGPKFWFLVDFKEIVQHNLLTFLLWAHLVAPVAVSVGGCRKDMFTLEFLSLSPKRRKYGKIENISLPTKGTKRR